MGDKSSKHFHRWRCIFGLIYLLVGWAIIGWLWRQDRLFYAFSADSFGDWPRFVTCVGASFIGFGFLLLHRLWFSSQKGFPWAYLSYYPVILLVCSSLVFAVCQMFDKTASHLFYFVALPIAFVAGYLADYFMPAVKKAVAKLEP